jgi:hypothetical protein
MKTVTVRAAIVFWKPENLFRMPFITALLPANVDILVREPSVFPCVGPHKLKPRIYEIKYHGWQRWIQMKNRGYLKSVIDAIAVGVGLLCHTLLRKKEPT